VSVVGNRFVALCAEYKSVFILIALSRFAREKFIEAGFDPDQIVVKGNTIEDPGVGLSTRDRRVVFVGRLSEEKGADFLMEVARGVDAIVEIIGHGPEYAKLAANCAPNVLMLGELTHEEVINHIKGAIAVVIPSRCYEGFPVVLLEALATATPVVVSDAGALSELVRDSNSGFAVPFGNVKAWREKLNYLLQQRNGANRFGTQGRNAYLERYSEGINGSQLIAIYHKAIERAARKRIPGLEIKDD
jgi:glycosyltransferase involved in cell wall biosynthesis